MRAAARSDGWMEAGLFAVALAVLNVSYGLGHQLAVQPVAFLMYAMPVAAISLLALSGPGSHWRAIVAHPLSLVVGSGIVAMEAVYYVLLMLVTPTDGSLLVRLGVPVAMAMGVMLGRGRPAPLALAGALLIVTVVAWYAPGMETQAPALSFALGAGCGAIMSARSFAAEFHPWNRKARTVVEKMRMTGLMLLVTSALGAALVLGVVALAAHGVVTAPAWLPAWRDFAHPPTIALGLFIGMIVLTAMQYLGFSVVLKIGTESFVATTALIPVATIALQEAAVRTGLLAPMTIDWRVAPAMAGIILGVLLVIVGGMRGR